MITQIRPKNTVKRPKDTVKKIIGRDVTTGARKELKDARFDLIPSAAMEQVARVYGYGTRKYAPRNWEKGYAWGWSYAALQRHLHAFWRGEEVDKESTLPHLAHAAWHCLTLLTFCARYREKDDRSQLR